jgi:hypothetical protein
MENKTNLLAVPYFSNAGYCDTEDALSDIFSTIEANPISYQPWPDIGIKPDAKFKLFYGDDAVFLKFMVKEKHFRASCRQINEPVYQDTCVEFFICFNENEPHYNFEFNALGVPLVGYGIKRERELLDVSLIKKIKSFDSYEKKDGDRLPFNWELTVAIPFDLFYKHKVTTLRGLECGANFCKCGDMLSEPHFLCWNNIVADKPDFHLPQYFGKLIFI